MSLQVSHQMANHKQTLFLQIFGLVAFIEQKENDNNDNLCKIQRINLVPKQCKGHHGFYIDCHCYRFLFAR